MACYIFFDEARNLDFSPSGTHYFILGSVTTRDPGPLTARLTALRYELFTDEVPPARFHATEDRQAVRDRLFEAIGEVGGHSTGTVGDLH